MGKTLVGYVVERWESAERVAELTEQYKALREKLGPEKWAEKIAEGVTVFDDYVEGRVAPHWYGVKGGKSYQWAKDHKAEQERASGVRHRVVKASFPDADTWMGYEIIEW